jgi:hypothetical protein
MTEIHSPPNERPIDEIYVFMSTDENGNHGILASILPNLGSTPLLTGSARAAEALKPIAAEVARASKKKIGLFKFKRVDQVWTFEG